MLMKFFSVARDITRDAGETQNKRYNTYDKSTGLVRNVKQIFLRPREDTYAHVCKFSKLENSASFFFLFLSFSLIHIHTPLIHERDVRLLYLVDYLKSLLPERIFSDP